MTSAATGSAHHHPNAHCNKSPASRIADRYAQKSAWRESECSAALHSDSRQADFCAYLSAILLAGLLLQWALGWWWADPVAALVMVPIIAREGWQGLRGQACDDCAS